MTLTFKPRGMDLSAIADGFTFEIVAFGGCDALTLLIRPDTDLDDRFRAYAVDLCHYVSIDGWNCTFEVMA